MSEVSIPIILGLIILTVAIILIVIDRINPYNVDIRKIKKQKRDHENALEVYMMILSEHSLCASAVATHRIIREEYIPHIKAVIGEMDALIKKLTKERNNITYQMMPR